jgi:hypothetical protein
MEHSGGSVSRTEGAFPRRAYRERRRGAKLEHREKSARRYASPNIRASSCSLLILRYFGARVEQKDNAPVAQGIEHRFPKPCAQVRFLPGAPMSKNSHERMPRPRMICSTSGRRDA